MKKKYYIIILVAISTIFGSVHSVFANQPTYNIKSTNKENIVVLNVSNHTYNIKVKDGSTVYDAMIALQSRKENNFSFSSKNYPSLGNFIYKINGVKGTPGKYWIYYINGKKASLGVSKYILKEGDRISWKQESF
jgi:uncharacterized membrane protein